MDQLALAPHTSKSTGRGRVVCGFTWRPQPHQTPRDFVRRAFAAAYSRQNAHSLSGKRGQSATFSPGAARSLGEHRRPWYCRWKRVAHSRPHLDYHFAISDTGHHRRPLFAWDAQRQQVGSFVTGWFLRCVPFHAYTCSREQGDSLGQGRPAFVVSNKDGCVLYYVENR